MNQDERLNHAESLFDSGVWDEAATEAGNILGNPALLSRAAVLRGRAMVLPLVEKILKDEVINPPPGMYREACKMFLLAKRLDPQNREASEELENLQSIFENIPGEKQHPNHSAPLDVVIVGAGASGIGVAMVLTKTFGLDPQRVLLVERGMAPGETFRLWPQEMRFISPSFNNQGWTNSFDLNSVMFGTSPAYTLGVEHPTGKEYAKYLQAVAKSGALHIRTNTEVTAVRPRQDGGFFVDINAVPASEAKILPLECRYVIWAAGEFQYPASPSSEFSGSEFCVHNSSVRSWSEIAGNNFLIVGGYESGMDAAFNLASCGKRCTVASSSPCWRIVTDDPSSELAPYTAQRIRQAMAMPTPPRLLAPLRVFKVEKVKNPNDISFLVHAEWGTPVRKQGARHRVPLCERDDSSVSGPGEQRNDEDHEMEEVPNTDSSDDDETSADDSEVWDGDEKGNENVLNNDDKVGEVGTKILLRTQHPPFLCTGFEGSVSIGIVKDLFEFGDEGGCAAGCPLLTDTDESTTTPGLFLVGPMVRHDQFSFCFVYKFRQRFGIVADTIAKGLGYKTELAVEECRNKEMYLDNLKKCDGICGESCVDV